MLIWGCITLYHYKPLNIYRAMLTTKAIGELTLCSNSILKLLGIISETEISHMLPEISVKFNTTHTYLVTGKNPVNGWTSLAKMESALCSRIESINKNTTQFPSATFLIHLSYAFHIHHALHCNSTAKFIPKKFFGFQTQQIGWGRWKKQEERQIYSIIALMGCKHDPSWVDLPSFVSFSC